jgi:hypothetical protein
MSADGKLAASLTLSAANSKTGPVAVRLQPARAAAVFLEDAGGKRLQGYVSFYMSAGKPAAPKKVEEERDAHLIVSIDIPGDAADKGAEVPGLLPGVKYLVKGSALGYSAVGGDPWTEWSFTQQDASPKLILKFEKR